jgi:polyhydroxyalkanoate synthesis regulator phasin
LYNDLKSEYGRLEDKWREMQNSKEQLNESKEQKIKILEDEMNYIKKHFDIELGLMKDENDILQRELSEIMNKSHYNLTPNAKH